MTCVELERIVQALSTSCCFVSNFEIWPRPTAGRTCVRKVAGDPAAAQQRRRRPTPAKLATNHLEGQRREVGSGGPWFAQQTFGVFLVADREKRRSRPISRVLSWTVIPLGASSPIRSSSLPGDTAGRGIVSLFGLAPGGVCHAGPLPDSRCALTAPFHPCHASRRIVRRFALCCTFRRLAPPRRYLAPCPVEPGLSSAPARLHDPMTRLPGRLRRAHCRTRPRRRLSPAITRRRTRPCAARR